MEVTVSTVCYFRQQTYRGKVPKTDQAKLLNEEKIQNNPFSADYVTDPGKLMEVLHIISSVPTKQQHTLLLYYYSGFCIQDIATAIEAPVWVTVMYLESARNRVLKELGMKNENMHFEPEEPPKVPVLKEIFDRYAEETITDEQLQRVLAPVLKMIQDQKFKKSRWRRYSWLMKPVVSVVAVVAIIAIVAVTQKNGVVDRDIVIQDNEVPLVARAVSMSSLAGRVCLEDNGVDGIAVSLVDTTSMKIVETAITNADGAYSFQTIPVGTYRLKVLLPDGMALVDGNTDGTVMVNQKTELLIDGKTVIEMKGVDIPVWLTN